MILGVALLGKADRSNFSLFCYNGIAFEIYYLLKMLP